MKVTGKKEPYLDFLRELIIGMFSAHGKLPSIGKKRPSIAAPDARFVLLSN